MRLCYGTFATVLRLCALNGKTQLDIHDALLMALDPEDKLLLARDNSQATRWFKCQTNLNPELIKAMEFVKPEKIAADFDEIVMGLIDPNKLAIAALALRDIIENDELIIPDAIVDYVNNVSKADLQKAPLSVMPAFFAGVFLYAVSIVRNKEGSAYISDINEGYLKKIASRDNVQKRNFQTDFTFETSESILLLNGVLKKDFSKSSGDKQAPYASELAILPIYLVVDSSFSMQEHKRHRIVFRFLRKLLSAMMASSSLSDKICVSVITFDEAATVSLPLSGLSEIERWVGENQENLDIFEGNYTYYGKAFELLRAVIQADVQKIQSKTEGGEKYTAFRPVVFFITDGEPNDDSFNREMAFKKLTDRSFEYRPNIVCIAIGDAQAQDLVAYGAGRYNTSDGSYKTGNSALVIGARDGVVPSKTVSVIVPYLVASIVNSFADTPAMSGSDSMPDIFGTQGSLFEDIDL